MFGWLRPKCPISVKEKVWIEQRFTWLVRVFGLQRLNEVVVVVPTPVFFPEPFRGTEAEVGSLVQHVCNWFKVDSNRFEFVFIDEKVAKIKQVHGLYQVDEAKKETISLSRSLLTDPISLIATIAHELAHGLLLGDGKISSDEADHEFVTDLLTVFLGLGVFSANAVIRESYKRGSLLYIWSISKNGYFSEDMYGYSLALFAWIRRERKPDWRTHLRPNVRRIFEKSLNYLYKTGDTQFQSSDEEKLIPEEEQLARLVAQLASPSEGARLAALWGLKNYGEKAVSALPALLPLLKDRNSYLRGDTLRVLSSIGPAAENAIPEILHLVLWDTKDEVCQTGVETLGAIGRCPDQVIPELIALLDKTELRMAAVRCLGAFGPPAAPAVSRLDRLLNGPTELCRETIQTLGSIGAAASFSVPTLIELVKQGEGDLPGLAIQALIEIDPQNPKVVEVLHDARENAVEEIREAAHAALNQMREP